MARIKSISNNGATTWLDITPSNIYGKEFTNKQFIIIMSRYLGVPINTKPTICLKCGDECDIYGTHALHCKHKNHCIQRHNSLRNILKKYFEKAGYDCQIEEKMAENNNVKGVPGDLKVFNWDSKHESTYFDVSVINVNAKTYVSMAAKERLAAATYKEKQKISKYNNQPNFVPLILETQGGIGNIFKKTLKKMTNTV